MTFQVSDFAGQVTLNAKIHSANPNVIAELNAIATALGTDPTLHDTTIQTAPAGLQPGNPANSHFTNDILLVVNAGKGGNLTPTQMANAITSGIAQFVPPQNTAAPVASGTGIVGNTLSVTTGTWTGAQTYTYQWLRGGANIAGAISATYVLQTADGGASVSCRVTGMNAVGETSALSNAIAVQGVPVNTVAPVASGTGTVASTLSVTTGTWSNTPTTYAYQWLRGGANIAGATAASYVLAAADSGTNVSCRVTASNASGAGTPVVSNAIAVA